MEWQYKADVYFHFFLWETNIQQNGANFLHSQMLYSTSQVFHKQ
jgi:hypothetical protein